MALWCWEDSVVLWHGLELPLGGTVLDQAVPWGPEYDGSFALMVPMLILRGKEVASYTGLPDAKEALEMAFEAGLGALIQSKWCTSDGYAIELPNRRYSRFKRTIEKADTVLGMSLEHGSTRRKQDGKWQLKNSAISMDVHSSLLVTVMDIASKPH
ncbi:hypothetical protein MUG91_G86n22 [Manis pentadactyla]|nr:hypothetical protein MUG91_G86n22 [Manis pentadactyla]